MGFYELEAFFAGYYGVFYAGWHFYYVAGFYGGFFAIEDGAAFAGDYGPDFIPFFVGMIIHFVTGVQGDLDDHGGFLDIEDAIGAPGFLGEGDLLIDGVDEGLDIGRLGFIGDQDAVRAGGDDQVLAAHDEEGDAHFVNDMDVGAILIHADIADGGLLHGLGEGVPGAEILPGAGVAEDFDGGFLFR